MQRGILQQTNKHTKAIKAMVPQKRGISNILIAILTQHNCKAITYVCVCANIIFYISTSSIFVYTAYHHCMQFLHIKCPVQISPKITEILFLPIPSWDQPSAGHTLTCPKLPNVPTSMWIECLQRYKFMNTQTGGCISRSI